MVFALGAAGEFGSRHSESPQKCPNQELNLGLHGHNVLS